MWCVQEDTLFRTSLKEIGTYMAGRRKNRIELRGDVAQGKELDVHLTRDARMAKFCILAGGEIFGLQRILGHSSLDMVRLYVDLFGSDVEEQHRKFRTGRWIQVNSSRRILNLFIY